MRTNLYSSLINTYIFNIDKHSYSGQYFEINNTYDMGNHNKYKSIPNQNYKLGILIPKKLTDNDLSENSLQNLASTLRMIIPKVEFTKLSKPQISENDGRASISVFKCNQKFKNHCEVTKTNW